MLLISMPTLHALGLQILSTMQLLACRFRRSVLPWLLLVCMGHVCANTGASTLPVLDLSLPSSSAAVNTSLPLSAITGLPASSTPEQALARLGNPAHAQAFDHQKVYALSSDTALWLHMRVRTDPLSQQRWVLNFVNTFLDRVELHAINAQGQWQSEIAGDNVAHSQWSQRTLAPQVLLPVMAAGEHDVLIKVVHGFGQQIPIRLMTQSDAEQTNRESFLRAGLLVGLLCLVLLLAVHLAMSYQDAAYAWYAVYMLLAILAASAYLGLTSYLLWPDAASWPEYSILILIQASVTAQLWFCQMMLLREGQYRLLRRGVYAVAGISVMLGVVYFFLPHPEQRMAVFAVSMGICIAMIFFIVGLAIKRTRQIAAYFWIAAYVPLIVTVVLSLLRHFSWISGFELPYELPVYPLIFEALVLLAGLHLHAKERHAFQEREKAVAALDPLTGFLNASTFQKQLRQMWDRAMFAQEDFALALVQVQHTTDRNDSESALKLERKLLRSVRLLRAIVRDVDVVGRIGGNTLAVAMPRIPMGDELNNRLSRLIAQGLMRDVYDENSSELRFRIAAGTRLSYGNNLGALDNNLRFEISQSSGWSRKPIHYITPETAPGELIQTAWAGKMDSGLQGAPDPAALSSGRSSGRNSGRSGPASSSNPASSR